MKKILIGLMLAASAPGVAQDESLAPFPVEGVSIVYSQVVPLEGSTKDQLYSRTKRWYVNSFTSSKAVIQLDDKENGEVIGKAILTENWNYGFGSYPVQIHFTSKVQVKDGKYKYTFCDFRVKFSSVGAGARDYDEALEDWEAVFKKKGKKELFEKIDSDIKTLIASLNKSMIQTESDW